MRARTNTAPDTTKGRRAAGAAGQGRGAHCARRTAAPARAGLAPEAAGAGTDAALPAPAHRPDARSAIESTVVGQGYELVDVERAPRGLLRVTIDRVSGRSYPSGEGEFVTVDDCELVMRQLQYALEVDGVAYARLEVSSPGLDRPLRTEGHFARFAGHAVSLVLKQPFQGRKAYKGVLGHGAGGQDWTLVFEDGQGQQELGFAFDEVREARLVPVVDFKGRKGRGLGQQSEHGAAAAGAAAEPQDGGQDR